MAQDTLSHEEIAQKGKEIYQQQIQAQVEIAENIGKIIAVDTETGNYEIDHDLIVACDRLSERYPNMRPWIGRIGYDAVYAIGGTLVRTAS